MTAADRFRSPTVLLELPGNDDLLAAAGCVALAHGQLELTLRMTIKTLSRLTVRQALNATDDYKNWQLRNEIKSLFKHHTLDPVLRIQMNAILGNCNKLSEKRNRLIHRAWALDQDGSVVVKGETHHWGPPPSLEDLTSLAQDISTQVKELNHERLYGFIAEISRTEPPTSS